MRGHSGIRQHRNGPFRSGERGPSTYEAVDNARGGEVGERPSRSALDELLGREVP